MISRRVLPDQLARRDIYLWQIQACSIFRIFCLVRPGILVGEYRQQAFHWWLNSWQVPPKIKIGKSRTRSLTKPCAVYWKHRRSLSGKRRRNPRIQAADRSGPRYYASTGLSRRGPLLRNSDQPPRTYSPPRGRTYRVSKRSRPNAATTLTQKLTHAATVV